MHCKHSGLLLIPDLIFICATIKIIHASSFYLAFHTYVVLFLLHPLPSCASVQSLASFDHLVLALLIKFVRSPFYFCLIPSIRSEKRFNPMNCYSYPHIPIIVMLLFTNVYLTSVHLLDLLLNSNTNFSLASLPSESMLLPFKLV